MMLLSALKNQDLASGHETLTRPGHVLISIRKLVIGNKKNRNITFASVIDRKSENIFDPFHVKESE